MRNKILMYLPAYGVLYLVVCAGISCSPKIRLPNGVMEIYITFAQNDSLKESEHFRPEYDVVGKYGKYLSSEKPEPGTKYKEYFRFFGEIVPLAVKENGELSLPTRYLVTTSPFGQTEVSQYRRGDHDSVTAPSWYRFKLRAGEQGLVFAVIPYKGNDILLYPGDLEPIVPSNIQEKCVESLGTSVRYVELPDLSSLSKATPEVRQIIHSLR